MLAAMRTEDGTALVSIVIGLAWGALTMAGPLAFPNAPIWVWQGSFLLAATIVVGGLIFVIYDLAIRPRLKGQPKLDPFLWIAATALLIGMVSLFIYIARGPQYLAFKAMAPEVGSSSPPNPSLSPSEKDRLSNVLFGLSQILTSQGEPIVTKAYAFSRTHTIGQGLKDNVRSEEQIAKLVEIKTDLTALFDSIYSDFMQKNAYYQHDITQLIESQLPIENLKEAANSYINIWNIITQTAGLDRAKIGGLVDLPNRDFLRTLNDFRQWLTACDQRIGQKRVALR